MSEIAVSAASTQAVPRIETRGPVWLFSAPVDLAAFLGSAAAALGLVAVGVWAGWLDDATPEWTWVAAVLLIDVAHVYATSFRVYFDRAEFLRRRWLYTLTPLVGYVIGASLYSESESLFWRVLAYLAVFHFVRQQYGWIAMYRRRAGECDRFGAWVDSAAIYLATLYPLVYWHAHMPRTFWWFVPNDFAGIPPLAAQIMAPFYWSILILYFGRSVFRACVHVEVNPGKDIVVATTAACWYVGIVALDSDFAFTVTNVLIHGVPYFVLVFWTRTPVNERSPSNRWLARGVGFLATLWVLAFSEELLWDHVAWHERGWLFGSGWNLERLRGMLVPLLAVPQLTHYVLDGFIWRRRSNPDVAAFIGRSRGG